MRILLKYCLLFLLVLVEHKALLAQADFEEDAAMWLVINLDKDITSNINAHVTIQNRINENVTQYFQGYADFGSTYKFNKNIKIMFDYVYAQRRILDGSFTPRHQFYTAIVLKQSYKRWDFIYRGRLQKRLQNLNTDQEGYLTVYHFRSKLTAKYEINKYISAYHAQEIYYPFYQAENKGLDRWRGIAGIYYNLNKDSKIELSYMYQHELNSFNRAQHIHVFGIGYEHSF